MEEPLERRHVAREEAPVLADAVAAHRRAPRLGPLLEKRQSPALGLRRVDAAREHALGETGAAVLLAVPVVHGGEHGGALMHRDDGPLGEHGEMLVGYDRGDFDDEIGFGRQARHFEIDPNEILGRLHFCMVAEAGN